MATHACRVSRRPSRRQSGRLEDLCQTSRVDMKTTFSQVALCQKLRVIQQEYNDLIVKMHSFDDHFQDAVTTCSGAKLTQPASFESRGLAEAELSVDNYTFDSIEPYIHTDTTPSPNPNVSAIPVAADLSLRHHSSEGDITMYPLQSTMSYPQNSTQVEPLEFGAAMDTQKWNFVEGYAESDSDVDVDISYDDTNPHVYRIRREAMSPLAVQSPVMISAINMDLSESYIDADTSMIAQRSSIINLTSILCDENVINKVVRRSSTYRNRRRSVPVRLVATNASKVEGSVIHRSLDSPCVPNTETEVNLDITLNSDATNFMDERLAPPSVTNLVRKDSRRRSIVKKLRHIGKQLRSKNKASLKTLAIV